MITFEDRVNGRIKVVFNFHKVKDKLGYIDCSASIYYFYPVNDCFLDMKSIQAISKKLEELNGGEK